MEALKVIFLDVDGVLNSALTARETRSGAQFVGARQVKNLRRIIQETGAKVVLSSDWRYGRSDPRMNADFLELKHELRRYGIRLFGFTSELCGARRGEEIDAWLRAHPEVSRFVILDDCPDVDPNRDHWVQTTLTRGLTKEDAETAIKLLSN